MSVSVDSFLETLPITSLRGVGVQMAERLKKIGVASVQDLLFHLPTRYMDRTRISPIGGLQPNTEVVIEGEVKGCDLVYGRRRSLICRLQDTTGTITLRFFHFSQAQKNNLRPGIRLRCFGEVRRGSSGLELYHPELQYLDRANPPELAQHLTAIYPASEGVTQQRIRGLVSQSLALLEKGALSELLPNETEVPGQQVNLVEALVFLHRPPVSAPLDQLSRGEHPCQQRLAFEELLAHHLGLLKLRHQVRSHKAPVLPPPEALLEGFYKHLPFVLTGAQKKVFRDIESDLLVPHPMLRLLQGDVGSGKTVVAALAVLHAVGNGYQAAVMAPTEILAEQHLVNFQQWCEPLGLRIAWLTGKLKGKARETQLKGIADGSAGIVIGTHALFQQDVQFHNLALTIIDEQHRFGVHQRLELRKKGQRGDSLPHQLIMTATPIPRTLAMSFYADLDCSVIDELPPGRTPVNTVVVSSQRRAEVIERIRDACSNRRQAYWVCTLIEESELLEAQAAEATADELQLVLPELSIGLVHGRLKPREKTRIMDEFKAGEIDLLVATTVVEVGVDVTNASLMIIENPERLGLAQLHQLRGRVGRGNIDSHCVLLFNAPLSTQSRERLKVMRQTCDGFQIAEKDLELRGPGEVMGTRQTGDILLRIADLQRDAHMLSDIKRIARQLVAKRPELTDALIRRWLAGREKLAQT